MKRGRQIEAAVGLKYLVNRGGSQAHDQESTHADKQHKFYESNIPVTGAEDFSYFSQEIPGLYFWLGVNKPGEGESANFGERTDVPGNHSPYFIVDDSALDEGGKALTYLVLDYPEKY